MNLLIHLNLRKWTFGKNPARNYEGILITLHGLLTLFKQKGMFCSIFVLIKLTETILLGVIAGRFPGEKLNWDKDKGQLKRVKPIYF